MKKILSTTAIAGSLCLLGTSAFAQFVGPYFAISGSMAGVATEGSKTTDTGGTGSTVANSGNAPVGAISPLAAFDLGYSAGAGKGTTVALGVTYSPLKAELNAKDNDTSNNTAGARNLEVKDLITVYIQPTFEITKDAAFFVKGFYSKADVSLSGTAVSKPSDLEGYGASAGLRVMLTKNSFVQVEAAYTQFDTISARVAEVTPSAAIAGIRQAETATTRTFTAKKPEVAEGRISIGFNF